MFSLSGLATLPHSVFSPLQDFPSSSRRKPLSQLHTKLPCVLAHVCPHSARSRAHSSISGRDRDTNHFKGPSVFINNILLSVVILERLKFKV